MPCLNKGKFDAAQPDSAAVFPQEDAENYAMLALKQNQHQEESLLLLVSSGLHHSHGTGQQYDMYSCTLPPLSPPSCLLHCCPVMTLPPVFPSSCFLHCCPVTLPP